jgi:hypothetical protein
MGNKPEGLIRIVKVKKGKDIPVTGRGGPYGCEMSRFTHFLDNRLIDGGEVTKETHLEMLLIAEVMYGQMGRKYNRE